MRASVCKRPSANEVYGYKVLEYEYLRTTATRARTTAGAPSQCAPAQSYGQRGVRCVMVLCLCPLQPWCSTVRFQRSPVFISYIQCTSRAAKQGYASGLRALVALWGEKNNPLLELALAMK